MKRYRRNPKTPIADEHHNPTNGALQPSKASPIVDLVEVRRRTSLVSLQRDFQALLKRQQRQQRRYAVAVANGDTRQVQLLATLLERSALRCQNVAAEIASRGVLKRETPERQKPKTTRNTSAHSKVRHVYSKP